MMMILYCCNVSVVVVAASLRCDWHFDWVDVPQVTVVSIAFVVVVMYRRMEVFHAQPLHVPVDRWTGSLLVPICYFGQESPPCLIV
jgi:hypothetical protein